jgi:serine/threonine-protein kinase RsbW
MATEITIPSDPSEAELVQELIEEALRIANYPETEIFRIKSAVAEALINALTHGNRMDPDKRVHISYTATAERFEVRITDEGPGFDYGSRFRPPAPTDPIVLDRPSGRGLLLMRTFMTAVQFHGAGNVVTMTKVREVAR